ncbi:DUF1206 domain-containing protein [Mesonia maritima]|uniref:DUF1206 domain-containing protein n=1 Tax=Mesonia maritima TaxID=1793873 RepID=A0ABU1KC11_9FLAO|nr:DUF1206 domain-containing protein [Mesonia maritima]MDR6302113.1 hypothetical protein [Mesonia maritima]
MDNSIKAIAKTGFVAKGIVYSIIGFLTLLAALDLGGYTSGKGQALDFIKGQPFGKFLLGILALGLLSYSIWRFIQVFKDPEERGNDFKALLAKAGFFISALAYIVLAVLAVKNIFNSGGGSGSSSSFILDKLGPTMSAIVFIAIGLGLLGKSIYHFVKAAKGKFLDKFRIDDLKLHKLVKFLGYLGFYGRSIVIGVIAYFFLNAGFISRSKNIKGTKEAFSFLKTSDYGSILVILTAAGLLSYGLFVIFMSRYHTFDKK